MSSIPCFFYWHIFHSLSRRLKIKYSKYTQTLLPLVLKLWLCCVYHCVFGECFFFFKFKPFGLLLFPFNSLIFLDHILIIIIRVNDMFSYKKKQRIYSFNCILLLTHFTIWFKKNRMMSLNWDRALGVGGSVSHIL